MSAFSAPRASVWRMAPQEQPSLFPDPAASADQAIVINRRCRITTRDGYRVVTVSGVTLAHCAVGDRMSEAHAMVSLIEQGWAEQKQVALALGCSERTIESDARPASQ